MPNPPDGFLLDQNLSWRIGKALRLASYPPSHVELEPQLGSGATDEPIVRWCGAHNHVWVTIDHDARSRHIRFSMLPALGVHAIILDPEPKGLRDQLWRIVTRFAEWEHTLANAPERGRAWVQRRQGRVKRLKGK